MLSSLMRSFALVALWSTMQMQMTQAQSSTGDRYIALSAYETNYPDDGSHLWDTKQYGKGLNFNSDTHYLIWGETTAKAFSAFEWYYTSTGVRSCAVRLYGTNTSTDPSASVNASNLPNNWQPVVHSMDTEGSEEGIYRAENVVLSEEYQGEAYVYWKLVWVSNLISYGPLYGSVTLAESCPSEFSYSLNGYMGDYLSTGTLVLDQAGMTLKECAEECTDSSCVGFNVYDARQCWIYSDISGDPVITVEVSPFCDKIAPPPPPGYTTYSLEEYSSTLTCACSGESMSRYRFSGSRFNELAECEVYCNAHLGCFGLSLDADGCDVLTRHTILNNISVPSAQYLPGSFACDSSGPDSGLTAGSCYTATVAGCGSWHYGATYETISGECWSNSTCGLVLSSKEACLEHCTSAGAGAATYISSTSACSCYAGNGRLESSSDHDGSNTYVHSIEICVECDGLWVEYSGSFAMDGCYDPNGDTVLGYPSYANRWDENILLRRASNGNPYWEVMSTSGTQMYIGVDATTTDYIYLTDPERAAWAVSRGDEPVPTVTARGVNSNTAAAELARVAGSVALQSGPEGSYLGGESTELVPADGTFVAFPMKCYSDVTVRLEAKVDIETSDETPFCLEVDSKEATVACGGWALPVTSGYEWSTSTWSPEVAVTEGYHVLYLHVSSLSMKLQSVRFAVGGGKCMFTEWAPNPPLPPPPPSPPPVASFGRFDGYWVTEAQYVTCDGDPKISSMRSTAAACQTMCGDQKYRYSVWWTSEVCWCYESCDSPSYIDADSYHISSLSQYHLGCMYIGPSYALSNAAGAADGAEYPYTGVAAISDCADLCARNDDCYAFIYYGDHDVHAGDCYLEKYGYAYEVVPYDGRDRYAGNCGVPFFTLNSDFYASSASNGQEAAVANWETSRAVVLTQGDLGLYSGTGPHFIGLRGNGAYARQSIYALFTGLTYKVSFSAAGNPAGTGEQSIAFYLDGRKMRKDTLKYEFAQYSFTFVATAEQHSMQIVNEAGAEDTVYLDHVEVRYLMPGTAIPGTDEEDDYWSVYKTYAYGGTYGGFRFCTDCVLDTLVDSESECDSFCNSDVTCQFSWYKVGAPDNQGCHVMTGCGGLSTDVTAHRSINGPKEICQIKKLLYNPM
ncbi:hypothetical protein CYMTET_45764 [Cymbomonas tetramitiformis]|uniref:Apple domain-containing protein n=1 Tax=Cymbomonas tetramitiformis TaxID=36881 RepID=A0AAE0EZD0_9CHLO|nr:hypothetical protein CYMTET_45764 [Cymbomonas tetramitiformis]